MKNVRYVLLKYYQEEHPSTNLTIIDIQLIIIDIRDNNQCQPLEACQESTYSPSAPTKKNHQKHPTPEEKEEEQKTFMI